MCGILRVGHAYTQPISLLGMTARKSCSIAARMLPVFASAWMDVRSISHKGNGLVATERCFAPRNMRALTGNAGIAHCALTHAGSAVDHNEAQPFYVIRVVSCSATTVI